MVQSDIVQIIDLVSKIAIGAVGAVVSAMLYLHYRQQRKDLWLQHFNEIHALFWNDEAVAEVRSWIACEAAYLEIKPVLEKRKAIEEDKLPPLSLEKSEYAVLEKLDKFCNLLMRAIALNPEFESQTFLWNRLFVDYWVNHIADETKRPELFWYVKAFYHDLLKPRRSS